MQKHSSVHKLQLKMQQFLGSHKLKKRSHLPKNLWKKFSGFAASSKKFNLSVHYWDTVNFRALWPNWALIFLTMPTQNISEQILTFFNLNQPSKKSGYFIDLFWKYRSFKNATVWLAESILADTSETIFLPNIGYVQHHSK